MFLLDAPTGAATGPAREAGRHGEPRRTSVVFSASDLVVAASCEYAVLRRLDARLGRGEAGQSSTDPVLERTARLGDAHEARVLAEYRERFGSAGPGEARGVVEIPSAWTASRSSLIRAHDATIEALRAGADVVYQGSFFDGGFHGRADFLVRQDDGAYAVYDTKLARHAKIEALLQLAAYADQLERAGVTPAAEVHLILGDRSESSHRTQDLLPLYRERRLRLETLLALHVASGAPVGWDDDGLSVCGGCEACTEQIEATRDVLLVAGLRKTQRTALRDAGIRTIDDLAALRRVPATGIGARTLDALRAQAVLQVGGRVRGQVPGASSSVEFEIFDPAALGVLPRPDPGDLFFDFEGDPLWADGARRDWGLEYLFGVVEGDEPEKPPYVAFWAHDRDAERMALRDFLDYVARRRTRHPRMHVYHYAAYEKSALLRLAARHAEGEVEVDDLLRDGVLVDLYQIVRSSLRTSQPSYSIKQLEPLYMGDDLRSGVTTAGDSIVEYALACRLRDAGDEESWQAKLDAIAEYNAYDCLSTLRLRDWLLDRAAEHGIAPRRSAAPGGNAGSGPELSEADAEEAMLFARLIVASGPRDPASRSADQQAAALVGAALGYYRREDKPAWWGHFDRLNSPLDEWADTRNTVRPDRAEARSEWRYPTPRSRSLRRVTRLYGALEEGSDLRPGAAVYTIYDTPVPEGAETATSGLRGWVKSARVTAVSGADDVPAWVDVLEGAPQGLGGWTQLPVAAGPGGPMSTKGQRAALVRLAEAVAVSLELPGKVVWPSNPALDVCRRIRPRLYGGKELPAHAPGEDDAAVVLRAVRSLDRSYLAVQGPPGTGKTYVGSHVIAALVAEGWKIGVVAQSHAVVENMLRAAARAGVRPDLIGKKVRSGAASGGASGVPAGQRGTAPTDHEPWHWLDQNRDFTAFQDRRPYGWLIGGTAWDFANRSRFPDTSLDLLVIDEAGQFSLANTLAVSWPARRLLLLGDPQQLPQVSQGMHPEPVDTSALAWLAEGHDTLPPERGYFLERTWRMHPELTRKVSRLAYEDRLHAVPETARRSLAGVVPGVRTIMVDHEGRSVASPEEAKVVLDLVHDLVGRAWTASASLPARPLMPEDIVVVAAYNAQVALIGKVLERAGHSGVAVGTVDKFQGREAAVVIVSMAASSAEEVPRGAGFLLSRNRINVAISRGQWAAFVVRSPRLTAHVPQRPAELSELGAFVGVCSG